MAEQDMRAWALKGAEHRLVEMAEEAKAIYATFPELRDAGDGNQSRRAGRPRKEDVTPGTEAPRQRRRRKMSKEARRKISEAQKARWAKQNAQSVGASTQEPAPVARHSKPGKQKRTMSAEARRKIGAAQKRRWQARRASSARNNK